MGSGHPRAQNFVPCVAADVPHAKNAKFEPAILGLTTRASGAIVVGEDGELCRVHAEVGAAAVLEAFVNVSAILGPGVYALVRDGVVVYVGQSKRMLSRVSAHKSNWGRKSTPSWLPPSCRGILFDEVHVLPCRVEDLDHIEAAMINLYKPRYNIRIKTPDPVTIAHLFAPTPSPPLPRRI